MLLVLQHPAPIFDGMDRRFDGSTVAYLSLKISTLRPDQRTAADNHEKGVVYSGV